MGKRIKSSWNKLKLEDKILALIIIVGSAACAAAGVTTMMEGLTGIASNMAFAFTGILIILGILTFCDRCSQRVRLILVYLFNALLFPLLFLVCGGV